MTGSKYGKLLTVLLIIAIVGVVIVLILIGVDVYNKFYLQKESEKQVAKFDEQIPDIMDGEFINNVNDSNTTSETVDNNYIDPYANIIKDDTTTSEEEETSSKQVLFHDFIQKGTISIPSTGLSSPVLETAVAPALEVAIAIQIGPGLNQVGNTVLAGHNYRNGTLFSNNKNINLGDKIYIKDTSGLTVTYVVYEKTEITPEDVSYINRDTDGKREITLYSCNDDSSMRIIIKAREQ